MGTIADIVISIVCFVSFSIVAISDSMLKSHSNGDDGFYPFLVIAAVAYLHWFAWYAIVPLKKMPKAERVVLQEKMKNYYSKSVFAGCIGLGYLLVSSYVVEWFLIPGRSQSQFYNPVWGGLALIVAGLLSRLHGLLRFLLLECKAQEGGRLNS